MDAEIFHSLARSPMILSKFRTLSCLGRFVNRKILAVGAEIGCDTSSNIHFRYTALLKHTCFPVNFRIIRAWLFYQSSLCIIRSAYLAKHISKMVCPKHKSDFQSVSVQVKGTFGVSECGHWWYRFFQHAPQCFSAKDIAPEKMKAFRHSLAKLINAAKSRYYLKTCM